MRLLSVSRESRDDDDDDDGTGDEDLTQVDDVDDTSSIGYVVGLIFIKI